jgi:hypothetical protein
MVALVFPLPQTDLGDLLPVQSVVWELVRQQETSGIGAGEMLVADLAPALWEASVSLRPLLHTAAREMAAKIDVLDGGMHALYLANPLGWWPAKDPGGALYGSSEPVIEDIEDSRKELSFSGLPANYKLTAGDMFSVAHGTRRGLYRLVADITADSSGETGAVEVRPHLRPGVIIGLDVNFKRPAAKVKIVPGSVSQSFHSVNRTRISFRVRQTLAAG